MIDYTSPVGQVRVLIPDLRKLEDLRDLRNEPRYLFTDDEILASRNDERIPERLAGLSRFLYLGTYRYHTGFYRDLAGTFHISGRKEESPRKKVSNSAERHLSTKTTSPSRKAASNSMNPERR